MKIALQPADVLVVVDVQVDFVTGTLAVAGAEHILPIVNRYLDAFQAHGLPIVATRDWHPPDHVSFKSRAGPWPAHCVAGTPGAEFAPGLALPSGVHVIDKGRARERDAYSGFEGTRMDGLLARLGARRLFVCGLATDYCVLNTVRDALHHGYDVFLLVDAIRAVDAAPGDGATAVRGMLQLGARALRVDEVEAPAHAHG